MAALVASVDGMATQYIARCSVQAPRLEMIEDLKNLMNVSILIENSFLAKELQSSAHVAKILSIQTTCL